MCRSVHTAMCICNIVIAPASPTLMHEYFSYSFRWRRRQSEKGHLLKTSLVNGPIYCTQGSFSVLTFIKFLGISSSIGLATCLKWFLDLCVCSVLPSQSHKTVVTEQTCCKSLNSAWWMAPVNYRPSYNGSTPAVHWVLRPLETAFILITKTLQVSSSDQYEQLQQFT